MKNKKIINRRTNFFVDRETQGAYGRFVVRSAAIFFGVAILFQALVIGANFLFFNRLGMSEVMRSTFWSAVGLNLLLLAGTFVVYGLLTYAFVIYLSHRVAGPAFSYERRLRHLALGDFKSPFISRKTDQLKELEASFNQFRMMTWQKFEDLESRREEYIKKISGIEDQAQKFRLQHLLKTPVVETLERHTSKRFTGTG